MLFHGRCVLDDVDAVRSEPQPDLDADRDPHAPDAGPDDAVKSIGVGEQRGSRPGPHHLSHGTASVDVDEVGFEARAEAGGVGHDRGIGAEELNPQGTFIVGDSEQFEGFGILSDQTVRAHHL